MDFQIEFRCPSFSGTALILGNAVCKLQSLCKNLYEKAFVVQGRGFAPSLSDHSFFSWGRGFAPIPERPLIFSWERGFSLSQQKCHCLKKLLFLFWKHSHKCIHIQHRRILKKTISTVRFCKKILSSAKISLGVIISKIPCLYSL